MKLISVRRYLILLFVFLVGVMVYKPVTGVTANSLGASDFSLGMFGTGIIFTDIFLNNLVVCLFTAFFGYLTGGLVVLVVVFWNGYLLSIFLHGGVGMMEMADFIYSLKHMPLEFVAIFMFGKFGLKGFDLYKDLLFQNRINLICKRDIISLRLPILLLLVSAIIEIL